MNLNYCFKDSPGRAIIFACQPPIIGAGKLKKREKCPLDKEKNYFIP